MTSWMIIAVVGAYVALLFLIAWRSDRGPGGRRHLPRSLAYALSLCVYCTTWTYFGAVGTAARSGWEYTTIYLGPVLAVTAAFPLWSRISAASKRVNAGSIADFLGGRYGNSRPLGALVAVVAIMGSLPYIALQLKSLLIGWELLRGADGEVDASYSSALVMAMILAGFAILFGARRADLTEHNRGLVQALAFESLVKLCGLLVAALAATVVLTGVPKVDFASSALTRPVNFDARFIVFTVLSTCALFCLPRQFHLGFVELENTEDTKSARRLLPIYLLLTTLLVVPIALANQVLSVGNPDLLVLEAPLAWGQPVVTAMVLLGGFSAATAMLIVEAVALSAMISNELVLPLVASRRWKEKTRFADHAAAILLVRRIAIVSLLGLAAFYVGELNPAEGLASIGITAFVAAAQFAPSLVGAVAWRRGSAAGAITGLAAGFCVWFYALMLPQVGWTTSPAWMGQGDPAVVAAIWSLSLNTVLFIVVSLARPLSLSERVQSALYMGRDLHELGAQKGELAGNVRDLRDLTVRFLGAQAAHRCFSDLAHQFGRSLDDDDPVDPALAREIERRLAGAIGSSSARSVVAVALSGDSRAPEEVKQILDEAAQAVQFSRDLLQAALDSMEQGISVVDSDLRIVAWNARYLRLFDFPPNFIHVGKPIAEVIRFNAVHGEWGEWGERGDIEERIQRRLNNLQRRLPHIYERERQNGVILKCAGAPIPGGGYVTTFTDISEDRKREKRLSLAADALEEANRTLERRVETRTVELQEAIAKAEAANASKSRFLAAASHDLLQPLHAARLFVGALAEDLKSAPAGVQRLAVQADRSIASADELLRALLNLSKLEAGKVEPDVQPVSVGDLLKELQREFLPIAEGKGLRLHCVGSTRWVLSDPSLLRSVLQNLIGNALSYTQKGRVLVGVRRAGGRIRIEVWDTGPGISDDVRGSIFREFTRGAAAGAAPGMGLGLAIVDRIGALLDHPIDLRSKVGAGSVFSVSLPVAPMRSLPNPQPNPTALLNGMRVLCIDDDPNILESIVALIGRWGGKTDKAASAEEAMLLGRTWDVALIDYHLGAGPTGAELIRRLGRHRLGRVAFVTAARDEEVIADARSLGVTILAKPLEPTTLRRFLTNARMMPAAE